MKYYSKKESIRQNTLNLGTKMLQSEFGYFKRCHDLNKLNF